jgi:hypothetical protein
MDLIGIGGPQVTEDVQCPLPGVARQGKIADGAVTVAEMAQHGRGLVTAALLPVQVERAMVAGYRLGVLAEVMVSVAEGVQRAGLAAEVMGSALQREGLTAARESLLVFPQESVIPADRVERLALSGLMPRGLVQPESVLCMFERFGMPALQLEDPAEAGVASG